MAKCLEGLEGRVNSDMNGRLLAAFTVEEVEIALGQMQPLKSPGPDGFVVGFYQNSWSTMGEKVCGVVLNFLNSGIFDPAINHTFIALIPKKLKPSCVTDFRPISLCNVVYKLCSKVLANRLKVVLPQIISPTQSAFILERLITDNLLVAFEALHTMNGRIRGRQGYMALKLDISKAYNRVEWAFLEEMMRRLGFAECWINLIMTCVNTVSYSILINGQPHGHIIPTRDLRQGDPLSPYLFILCAEGLSNLISKAEMNGRVLGLPITRGGTKIGHLFFADDSLLFCKANLFE